MTRWTGPTGWSTTLVTALVIGSVVPAGPPSVPPGDAASRPAAAALPSGADKVTEAARAAETARRTGTPVEIVGERTETSRVFANPSGTRTLEQYALPVQTRRDGRWVPIDTRLARDADGRIAPAATPIGLRLSGGGAGPLVTAEQDGAELALSWPAPLPAPVLNGDTAIYPEVLPGVDLRVRVNPVGFSQVLVVKDAAAARNPALRRIRFGTQTRGLTLRAGADGSSTAVDPSGRPVFSSGPPVMWDSTPAPAEAGSTGARTTEAGPDSVEPEPVGPDPATAGRQRVMGLEVGPGELVVVPDPDLLVGPDTRYPVYLDPSYSAVQYRWTMVNHDKPSTSYWTDDYYRKDVRVGSVYGSGDGPWRTFFQMRVARLPGATILRAWFSVSMTHTANCAETSVELWHTKLIDPATALTWNNSSGHWLEGKALATRSGKANKSACGQPPMLMEFGLNPDTVTPVVQQAVRGADGPQEAVGFGLRIPSARENDTLYWKRFDPATARLNIEYNTPPESPTGVSTVPPTRCGTATAPTALNTATPTFSGVGYDRDGDNLTNELEVLSGETVLTRLGSGTVGTGTMVRWSPVPAGILPTDSPGTVFSYRARSRDAGLTGGYGDRCYFTVDTARPAPPVVSSTDYPGPTAAVPVGQAGVVTFRPGGAETDIAGYRYGFSQDVTTMWVAAGADGRASVPITLWPSDPTEVGEIHRTLYVRAIDRAGNSSPLSPGHELVARARSGFDPPVRGDVNGDRRGDVTTLVDHGYDRTAVWNLLAGPDGFHPGYIAWDTDIGGGFPADLVRAATGDFDGDGRTDLAVFREDPDQTVRLFLLRSDGNRFVAASEPVWSGTTFRLSHLRVVAGDFDGDGDDDLAGYQGLADGQVRLWTFRSDRVRFAAPVSHWDSGAGGPGLAGVNLIAGDFDGDGDDDVADAHDAGDGRTRLLVHTAADGSFGAPTLHWDSGAGGLDAGRARFVAANVTGDPAGTAEVVALVDDGAATARLVTIAHQGGTWTAATWWSSGAGGFDATRATLAAGDFDADGRDDIAALSDVGGGNRRLVSFPSTGTSFAAPRIDWEGYVSDAAPTLHLDPSRRYRIHPVHSGKCFDVPGGSTANDVVIDQWDCVTTASWEQFRFERVGASPYYQIRTAAGKCVDLKAWSLLDSTPVLQYTCHEAGATKPNQQFRLELLSGGGYEPVVRLRVVHSDKCLRVDGATVANGAQIVQAPCGTTSPPEARFALRTEP